MVEKSIRVRKNHIPVWDEAEELVGSAEFPRLITNLLRDYVRREKAKQEARSKPTTTIEFDFEDDAGRMLKKSFEGRWVIDFKDRFKLPLITYSEEGEEQEDESYAVAAITAKGQIFFALYHPDEGDYLVDYCVYGSVEEAERGGEDTAVLTIVAAELGRTFVEELDISTPRKSQTQESGSQPFPGRATRATNQY